MFAWVIYSFPASIYFFKLNNRNTRTMPKICSKLAINRRQCIVLVSLLLTLNRFHVLFWYFHCWLWTSKCRLGYIIFCLGKHLLYSYTMQFWIRRTSSRRTWTEVYTLLSSNKHLRRFPYTAALITAALMYQKDCDLSGGFVRLEVHLLFLLRLGFCLKCDSIFSEIWTSHTYSLYTKWLLTIICMK